MQQLEQLYSSVEWYDYCRPDKLERLLPGSVWYMTAWHGSELVGLIRAIGDDVSVAYIQDLLIRPEYQRKGIGSELLRQALQRFDHIRQFVLMTDDDPEHRAFYEAVGMRPASDMHCTCFVRFQMGL